MAYKSRDRRRMTRRDLAIYLLAFLLAIRDILLALKALL
jgi:hypothetical protein